MESGTGRAYGEDAMRNLIVSRRRGFTFMELMVVLAMIGIMTAVAIPYLRSSTSKGAARGAADAVTALHARARMAAIQRGRSAKLVIPSGTNRVLVVANKVATTGIDTLGKVVDLASEYGVTITSTSDTV